MRPRLLLFVHETAVTGAAARRAAAVPVCQRSSFVAMPHCSPTANHRRFLAMARSHLDMGVPLFIDRDLDELVGTVRGLQARILQGGGRVRGEDGGAGEGEGTAPVASHSTGCLLACAPRFLWPSWTDSFNLLLPLPVLTPPAPQAGSAALPARHQRV